MFIITKGIGECKSLGHTHYILRLTNRDKGVQACRGEENENYACMFMSEERNKIKG